MAGRKGINWIAIRTAYVVKGWTAEKCSEEFRVARATISRRASKEGWTTERHRNVTNGEAAVTEEVRRVVAETVAGHVAVAERQVELTGLLSEKLKEAANLVDLTDIRKLRSLIEAGARLGEWTDKVVSTSRTARGLKPGVPSDETTSGDDGVFQYDWKEAPRPADEADKTATA